MPADVLLERNIHGVLFCPVMSDLFASSINRSSIAMFAGTGYPGTDFYTNIHALVCGIHGFP